MSAAAALFISSTLLRAFATFAFSSANLSPPDGCPERCHLPSDRKTIVITDFIEKHDPIEAERRVIGDLADFRILDAHHEDELVGHVEDAEAIVLYHNLPMLSPKTIDRLERCKLIVRGGVGYDNVDATYARARGIPVATVPDYGTEEVADSAIGLMLTMTRGISYLNSRLRDRQGPWMYHQVKPLHRL